MKYTFAVIGAGNGGQAMAAHLSLLGHSVRLQDTDKDKIQKLQEVGVITAEGKVEGIAEIEKITSDLKEAVQGADAIMVTTTTDCHIELAEALLPLLEEKQVVVLCPGQTGGVILVHNIFEAAGKQIPVAEMQDLIYTCRATEPGKVKVTALKQKMDFAGYNQADYDCIIGLIGEIYPQLRQAQSVLHTGFDNMGAILHPAPMLLNAGRIESGEDFLYYKEGISPSVAVVLEEMDKERVAVAKAYGVEATSIPQWQKNAYNVEGNSFYELFQNNKSYAAVKGSKTLHDRYLTEDVPCGLVPIVELGKLAGVPTPAMESVIELAGMILATDFKRNGRTLKCLGLEGKTVDEIKKMFL